MNWKEWKMNFVEVIHIETSYPIKICQNILKEHIEDLKEMYIDGFVFGDAVDSIILKMKK